MFSYEFCKIFQTSFDRILVNVCFGLKYEIPETSQNVIVYTLWNTVHTKTLIMPAFCNGFNLPTLAKEKTCHIISQSQVCIDLS